MDAKAGSASGGAVAADGVQVFRLKGPAWRPRLHPGSKAIGLPDLGSHNVKQAEDEISETAVKNGFSVPQVVGNETFSAHDMIHDRLKPVSLLSQLGSFLNEVSLRRDDLTNHRSTSAPLQSRAPQRVTLNEVKLAAYIKELADPQVPLKKLARSVPHGYRGERMLDMLWNGGNLAPALAAIKAQALTTSKQDASTPRSVTVERAVWFIRVVGSSEMSSNRTRLGSVSSYTTEWTSVFMGWLRRQIVELNIVSSGTAVTPTTPSSPNISRQIGQARTTHTPANYDGHYSLLLEDDFRHRWVSKWHYTIQLLRSLCNENLVDTQTALKCTLDMLRTSNLAQITFLVALTQELMMSAYSNAVLVQYALDVLYAKVNVFAVSVEDERFTSSIKRELRTMIEHIAMKCPNSLVNPNRWLKYRTEVTSVIEICFTKDVGQALIRRNEVLISLLLKPEGSGPSSSLMGSKRHDISLLDKLAVTSSLQDTFIQLFRPGKTSEGEKLRTILVWSTTTSRKGRHRPFAGAQLLYLYSRGKAPSVGANGRVSAAAAAASAHKMELGTFLFRWISEVESALYENKEERATRAAVGVSQSIDVSLLIVLVGELVRLGVFSYSKYIQRLTARGMTASQVRDEKTSPTGHLHAKIMRSIPLLHTSASLEHQRRVAIYGNRSKESWEEAMQRRAAKELMLAFPWHQSVQSEESPLEWNAGEPLRHFWSSSPFVQHRVIQTHIMPYFQEAASFDTLSASCLSHLARFLIAADDCVSLCEVILCLQDRGQRTNGETACLIRSLIRAHRHVWIALDVPLLERIGVSPFPSYVARPEATHHSKLVDADVRIALQQSATQYLVGNEEQAGALLIDEDAQRLSSLEVLAITVMCAASDAFQANISSDTPGKTITGWLKLVTSAAGLVWDDKWQTELATSLISFDIESEEQGRALAAIVSELVMNNASLGVDVLREYIVPRLTLTVRARETSTIPSTQCLLTLLQGLFERESYASDALANTRIVAVQSTVVVSSTLKVLHSVIRLLAVLGESAPAPDSRIDETIRVICTNPIVQLHSQPILFDLCSYLQETVRGSVLGAIIKYLVSPSPSLLQSNALDVDFRNWLEAADDWHVQQMQTELCVMVQQLEVVESGQQNRAQSKIQSIAKLAAQKWFTGEAIREVGLPLLLESRSILFATTIGEELLKGVLGSILFAGEGRVNSLVGSLQCAKLFAQSKAKTALPSSSVAPVLLSALYEQLDQSNDCWHEDSTFDEVDLDQHLAALLSALCLLLQFDNIWSTAQSRTVAPQLVFALFRQAVRLSCLGEANQSMTTQILDVAAYILQHTPSEIVATVQGSGDAMLDVIKEAMPGDEVASRILFLLNCTEKSPSSSVCSMILAPNSASIFSSRRFVADKPWEYHNNVEALDYYLRENSHQLNDDCGERQDEMDSALLPLVNNGPISLEFFSAKKTRDRIAPSTVKIDSEVSYGTGQGGEPMYARDIRRSLLGLEADEEVKKQGRSLARLKGAAASNKQAASDSATPKASTDADAMATTKKRKDADSSSAIKESAGDAKKKSRKR